MHRKDKPMFLLDTHSSRGMFKLNSPEAMRSPEHLQGQPFEAQNSKSTVDQGASTAAHEICK